MTDQTAIPPSLSDSTIRIPLGLLDRLWLGFGRQLRCPRGLGGHLIGRLMVLLNHRPNEMAIDALDLSPTDRVLEVGFGPGRSLRTLCERVTHGQVHGIDRSVVMYEQAACANRSATLSGRLSLRHGSADALPFDTGAFDKLLLVNVVYFFDHAGRDIAEVHRVLRPGGRVVIYATQGHPRDKWAFSDGSEPHRTFDADELRALLREGGFADTAIDIRPVAFPLGIRGLIAVAHRTTDEAARVVARS